MYASKRQKLSPCEHSKNTQKVIFDEFCYSHSLDTLPPEILEMILRLLSFHDVATVIRLVSRRCSTIATTVLNNAFLTAGTRLEIAMKRIEAMMPNIKTDTELLLYGKAFNTLELIKAQYKMLRAVTWRYTHSPKEEKFPRLCFYAGSLLDSLNNLLHRAMKHPMALINSDNNTDISIACFITLCKRFMNYFEKVSERRINRSALISGCKIVDLLDCLAEGRQVLLLKVSLNKRNKIGMVTMKLRYVMKRAWFTCLKVSNVNNENSWSDEQRFMYLRLRRLVGSVNEHLFEKLHYEREVLLRAMASTIPIPIPPPASTYSGYGEYAGRFFYYGNMNTYAYDSKFKVTETAITRNATRNESETENGAHRTPSFNLIVVVELKCSPELAPFEVKKLLKPNESAVLNNNRSYCHQELYLNLNITCPASIANRLPGVFTWELCSPRRIYRS